MNPPVFSTVNIAAVQAVLGTSPLRVYQFGYAPQDVTLPYAVWQTIGGGPENYIDCAPDIDLFTIQFDTYAETASSARQAAEVLRDAIEPYAHIVSWRGESRDTDTNHYRYSFDVDWWAAR